MYNDNKEEPMLSLIDLFNLWYGIKFYPTNEQKKQNLLTTNLDYAHIRNQWDNVWFAKNEKQLIIDKELLKFETFIDQYKDYSTSDLYEKMSLIVIYDQLTRNIYRETSKAYDYDHISRQIALNLLENIQNLPFQYKLTVLICLCHSENIEHQNKVRECINELKESQNFQNYKEIINTLLKISDNHYTRVSNFGRIPERNKFVGRENTKLEDLFLKNFV